MTTKTKTDGKTSQTLTWKQVKNQIVEDLNASVNQKQFINTLSFYFRVNSHWQKWKLKEVSQEE